MVSWKDAVWKKVLIRKKGSERIREVYVERLSPSGRYAKVREDWAIEEWINTDDYYILEMLA